MAVASERAILSVLFLIAIISAAVHGLHAKWQHLDDDRHIDCMPTDAQWQLIAWYFDRVSYVELTELVENANDKNQQRYVVDLVRNLPARVSKPLRMQTVDLSVDEGNVTRTQRYGWRGVYFAARANVTKPNDQHVRVSRESAASIKKLTRHVNHGSVDAAMRGSLVVVDSTHLLDDYLIGYPRRPFNHPRARVIVLVYRNESEAIWEMNAAKLMARLWKIYSILNAIVISPCRAQEVCYTFNINTM